MIVGRAITPRSSEAASHVSPVGISKLTRIKFVRTIKPKNPYTTEGIPASSSTAGLRIFFVRGDASSERYIAQPMDSGTAKTMAPMVTNRVPTMSGKIPYNGTIAVGAQSGPRRKAGKPTSTKIG
jgi:hypothetical protein